ncbi:MAG: ATP-grasp domain-containing protein, partial [Cytophagales bacterium]|nr:ATP-grasp domain-containing protein [Armatimonadota bacterium]
YDAAAGSGSILPPPSLRFAGVARQVRSRFFTMDVAQQDADGEWLIVEIGDGQVSGLPEGMDRAAFYDAIRERRIGS